MKQRQLNLFANKKHFRQFREQLRKEAREIMERQKPKPEQPRKEIGCVRP
jgi:hypothetical protein